MPPKSLPLKLWTSYTQASTSDDTLIEDTIRHLAAPLQKSMLPGGTHLAQALAVLGHVSREIHKRDDATAAQQKVTLNESSQVTATGATRPQSTQMRKGATKGSTQSPSSLVVHAALEFTAGQWASIAKHHAAIFAPLYVSKWVGAHQDGPVKESLTQANNILTAAGGQVWGPAQEMLLGPILAAFSFPDSTLDSHAFQASWSRWWKSHLRLGTLPAAGAELREIARLYGSSKLWETIFQTFPRTQASREWIAQASAADLTDLVFTKAPDSWRVHKQQQRLRLFLTTSAPESVAQMCCESIAQARTKSLESNIPGILSQIGSKELPVTPAGHDRVFQQLLHAVAPVETTSGLSPILPANKKSWMLENKEAATRLLPVRAALKDWSFLSDAQWPLWEEYITTQHPSEIGARTALLRHPSIPESRATALLEIDSSSVLRHSASANSALLARSPVIRARLLAEGQSKAVWLAVFKATNDGKEAGQIIEFLVQKGHQHVATYLFHRATQDGRSLVVSSELLKTMLLNPQSREIRIAAIKVAGTSGSVLHGEMSPLPARSRARRT